MQCQKGYDRARLEISRLMITRGATSTSSSILILISYRGPARELIYTSVSVIMGIQLIRTERYMY